MPIYEFECPDCHKVNEIFEFASKSIVPPECCGKQSLRKFSIPVTFPLHDSWRTGDLTAAHAKDIMSRVRINDNGVERVVRQHEL